MEPSAQKAERRPPRAARPPGARFPTRGWGKHLTRGRGELGGAATVAPQAPGHRCPEAPARGPGGRRGSGAPQGPSPRPRPGLSAAIIPEMPRKPASSASSRGQQPTAHPLGRRSSRSLRPGSPGGHPWTHFRLGPLVVSPRLLSDVDTPVSASSEAGEFRVPSRLCPVWYRGRNSKPPLCPFSLHPPNHPEKTIMMMVIMIIKTDAINN